MDRKSLFDQILKKNSYLCVGLDPDIKKIPGFLLKEKDPIFEFNRQIIDSTNQFCVAYKPNIAFYESLGSKGWDSLQKTLDYIPKDIFTIADAKRGDIGNTSDLYARTFFDRESSGLSFDAITIAPYMGKDSVMPFLKYKDKWAILLALTSNEGGEDFQTLKIGDEELYIKVIKKAIQWSSSDQLMFVVGATKPELLLKIRKTANDYFLLVPGVGAQGGSLLDVSKNGMNSECGLLVNSSRNIIYASNDEHFAKAAAKASLLVQQEMEQYLNIFLK